LGHASPGERSANAMIQNDNNGVLNVVSKEQRASISSVLRPEVDGRDWPSVGDPIVIMDNLGLLYGATRRL
jgi:hypothetical protein